MWIVDKLELQLKFKLAYKVFIRNLRLQHFQFVQLKSMKSRLASNVKYLGYWEKSKQNNKLLCLIKTY